MRVSVIAAGCLFVSCVFPGLAQERAREIELPLGYPGTLHDIYIPGGAVEPIPRKDSEPSLVIRILDAKPAADGFRYDFDVYALDPGEHQLGSFLQYDDGTPVETLDYVIRATLRHDVQILPQPAALQPVQPARIGGYQIMVITLGVLWFAGLLFILFHRKKRSGSKTAASMPVTPKERLRVLVTAAAQGKLSPEQKAQLERLIVGHWRNELPELESLAPSAAIHRLRSHPDASPLVLKLEEWLHSPDPSTSQDDINPLLTAFR